MEFLEVRLISYNLERKDHIYIFFYYNSVNIVSTIKFGMYKDLKYFFYLQH